MFEMIASFSGDISQAYMTAFPVAILLEKAKMQFAEQRIWYNETCLIGLTVLGEPSSSLKQLGQFNGFYSLGRIV